jgi:hypothetical protein
MMAVALAAGLWIHYYAVLAFLPIVAGEIARQIRAKHLDWHLWVALGLAAIAGAPLVVLARAGARQIGAFWARQQGTGPINVYGSLLATLLGSRFRAIGAIVAVVIIAGIVAGTRRRRSDWPIHETAAGFVALSLPAAGWLLAHLVGYDVFIPRYVLFTVIGLVVGLVLGVWRAGPANGAAEAAAFVLVAAMFCRLLWQTFEPGQFVYERPVARHRILADTMAKGDRVVVTGGVEFLALWYDASPDERTRLMYAADPEQERAQTRTDSIDRGYLALARWSDVPIVDAAEFVTARHDFELYDFGSSWLVPRVRAAGGVLLPIAHDSSGSLYRVHFGAADGPVGVK